MQARYVRRRVMPIAYIQRTRERYADSPPYKWAVNPEAPWTPLPKPIKESRLALVSSGGFYLKSQPPFEEDDTSYRAIPKDTDLKELRIYHHGYRDADADLYPHCASWGRPGSSAPSSIRRSRS